MSLFAKRFTGQSGIVTLMEDLGDALNSNLEMIFMGGGNPAHIPAVESILAKHLQRITADSHKFHKLIGEYQPPQGDPGFLSVLVGFLNQQYGWKLTENNVAVCNGGQTGFFTLFNMLASEDDQGDHKTVVLPIVPDYLGYADAGLQASMFIGTRPHIKLLKEPYFKYEIDFEGLEIGNNTAAVCISRPANPSGNVVTDNEIERLKVLCQQRGIPLVIDAAYGKPFPDVTFSQHTLSWDENTILILSLSKLGMPGVRTGLVIACDDIIQRFSRATASLSLAPSNLGPIIMKSLIATGDIKLIVEQHVRPFYRSKMQQTVGYLIERFANLPLKIHQPEGAFFLWLWFQNLPVDSQQLYERLKAKGVLVLSGHHFFKPLSEDWDHRHQCIRLSYCQPWERVQRGIDIIAEEIENIYSKS